MKVDEYIPSCGWMRYHHRHRLIERAQVAFAVSVVLMAYAFCGYIEYLY